MTRRYHSPLATPMIGRERSTPDPAPSSAVVDRGRAAAARRWCRPWRARRGRPATLRPMSTWVTIGCTSSERMVMTGLRLGRLLGALGAVEPDRGLHHAARADRPIAALARHAGPTVRVAVAGRDRSLRAVGPSATERYRRRARSPAAAAARSARSATGEGGLARAVLEERGHADLASSVRNDVDERLLLDLQAGRRGRSRARRRWRAWPGPGPPPRPAASSAA